MEETSKNPPSQFVAAVKAIAELSSSLAWPGLFLVLLLLQRKPLGRLLEAVVELVRYSTRIKLGELIDVEVDRSAKEVEQKGSPPREVPAEQLKAASRVGRIVTDLDLPAVRSRILEFAREYEATRSNMKPGTERTRAMNAIVAKMRTLAIAAHPFVKELASSEDSPGYRLAAIVILQLNPSMELVPWLVDRMRVEQPFVFFHASLALLATVRSFGASEHKRLREAIQKALAAVKSFGGGPPDQNTIEVLESALSELNHR